MATSFVVVEPKEVARVAGDQSGKPFKIDLSLRGTLAPPTDWRKICLQHEVSEPQ